MDHMEHCGSQPIIDKEIRRVWRLSLPNKNIRTIGSKNPTVSITTIRKEDKNAEDPKKDTTEDKKPAVKAPKVAGNDLAAIMSYLKNINDNIDEVICKQKKSDKDIKFIRMESMPNINHSIKAIQVDIVNLNDKVGTLKKNNPNKLINKFTKKSLEYEQRNHVGIQQ